MTYDTTLPVRVRIGDRPEWTVGHVPADNTGRVDPRAVACMLAAVADHMHRLVDRQHGIPPRTRTKRRTRNR